MENVSLKDREILREIASRKAALANCARNDEILKMWKLQAQGVRDLPTVRLLFSNFPKDIDALPFVLFSLNKTYILVVVPSVHCS